MKTNLDKWDYHLDILNARTESFIKEAFQDDPAPETLYEVTPIGTVKVYTVTDINYRFPRNDGIRPYFYGKKPTREEVQRIATAAIEEIDFNKANIVLGYEYEWGSGNKAISGISMERLLESSCVFTDQSKAGVCAAEKRLKKEKEQYLLANGHIKCTYCGKVVPESEAVNYTVIARQYTNMRKTSKYCSRQCGAHDQMAHEG